MSDKPFWMIASALFFGIAVYCIINYKADTWIGLCNYFFFVLVFQTFGWIAFGKAM